MPKNLMKLEDSEVGAAFKANLKRLWSALPSLPKRLLATIDGTFIELGPKAKGAGVSKRTKQVRAQAGLQSVAVAILGFKMVWLYVPELGLPLAVAFGTRGREGPKIYTNWMAIRCDACQGATRALR